MRKRLFTSLILMILMINIVGCGEEEERVYRKAPENTMFEQETKEQVEESISNIKDNTTSNFEIHKPEKEIKTKDKKQKKLKVASVSQLMRDLTNELNKSTSEYEIEQDIEYDYIRINKNSMDGYYNSVNKKETKKGNNYKVVIEKTCNNIFSREILEVENRNNVIWVGYFNTKDKEKEIKYDMVADDDIFYRELVGVKNVDFGEVNEVIEYTDETNFKVKTKMNVRQLKAIANIEDGFNTIDEEEKIVKIATGEKGNEKIVNAKVVPSNVATDVIITVEDGVISFEAELTELMKEYYHYYNDYDINTLIMKLRMVKKDNIATKSEAIIDTKKFNFNKMKKK